jgi:hypothetical protein
MFSFFKSDKARIKVVDKVWMSKEAKLAACKAMLELNPQTLFVVWFDQTYQELRTYLGLHPDATDVIFARDLSITHAHSRLVVFAEHYPLSGPEQEQFSRLELKEVPVLSALDEPLFQYFSGYKIVGLMKQLGMKENEVVGHSLVSKSIVNAQEKLERKAVAEKHATSQDEWFLKNIGPRK